MAAIGGTATAGTKTGATSDGSRRFVIGTARPSAGVEPALEICDVIVDYDPVALERRPVTRERALERLAASGASRAALRCAAAIPARADGVLDPEAVDALLLSAHGEMQRLWETFLHGARVAQVLGAIVAAARAIGVTERLRVVDIGCGSGYVVRWLAAHRVLSGEVELVGADYNRALIERARRLAAIERLDGSFLVANAFSLDTPAHVFLSTGVLHHFRGPALEGLFAAQARCRPLAFAHFDARRSWASPIGAWLFHKAKYRVRLGQLDGFLSARRAHGTEVLLEAARTGSDGMRIAEFNRPIRFLPMLRAMHGVLGVRPELEAPLVAALDPRGRILGPFA